MKKLFVKFFPQIFRNLKKKNIKTIDIEYDSFDT